MFENVVQLRPNFENFIAVLELLYQNKIITNANQLLDLKERYYRFRSILDDFEEIQLNMN